MKTTTTTTETANYNGWTNYETWTIAIRCTSLSDVEFVREEIINSVETLPEFARDLYQNAIDEINWDELNDAFSENDDEE